MSTVLNGHEQDGLVVGARLGGHVAEMQRRRMLNATVEMLAERGAQSMSIAALSQRAGVSRKTFYEVFADREACLCAAFEETVLRIERDVSSAVANERKWLSRTRAGLAALLSHLDREPACARLVVVEALGAGEPTLEARRGVLDRLIAIVDEGRGEAKREPPPLTAEGVVGAVFSVVHARVLDRDPRPLGELLGPLMAMIVQPYLGAAAAQREIDAQAHASISETAPPTRAVRVSRAMADPFKDLPMRLTYRTALVLSSIAESPGASSKQVAAAAGVPDQGQMSRLLARLRRFDLIENRGGQPTRGEAMAWTLTAKGRELLRAVTEA
jgi:AcrR family transcriptional regulator